MAKRKPAIGQDKLVAAHNKEWQVSEYQVDNHTASAFEQEVLATRLDTLMQKLETAIDKAIAKLNRMV